MALFKHYYEHNTVIGLHHTIPAETSPLNACTAQSSRQRELGYHHSMRPEQDSLSMYRDAVMQPQC